MALGHLRSSTDTISLRFTPRAAARSFQAVADDFAVGRAGGGGDFEAHAIGLHPQMRACQHRGRAAGKAVGEQDRPAEDLRAPAASPATTGRSPD